MRCFLVLLAACGSSPTQDTTPHQTATSDSCERIIQRSRPVLEKTGSGGGDDPTDADIQYAIARCREDAADPLVKELIACVDNAHDNTAIHACWEKDELREAAEP